MCTAVHGEIKEALKDARCDGFLIFSYFCQQSGGAARREVHVLRPFQNEAKLEGVVFSEKIVAEKWVHEMPICSCKGWALIQSGKYCIRVVHGTRGPSLFEPFLGNGDVSWTEESLGHLP